MSGTIAALGIVFLAILGTPLFIIMSLAAMVAFTFSGVEVSAVAQEFYRISSAPTLMTIPLFTFAGYLMAESKSPQRLLKLAETGLGWLPGGVSIVALVVCAFFTAFTGASGVTIIALGGLIYPILIKDGYTEKYSLGMVTASGSLGLLFPPSLPIILYGLVAKVDIDKLFKAGLLPGLVIMIILSAWAIFKRFFTSIERILVGSSLTSCRFSWNIWWVCNGNRSRCIHCSLCLYNRSIYL